MIGKQRRRGCPYTKGIPQQYLILMCSFINEKILIQSIFLSSKCGLLFTSAAFQTSFDHGCKHLGSQCLKYTLYIKEHGVCVCVGGGGGGGVTNEVVDTKHNYRKCFTKATTQQI